MYILAEIRSVGGTPRKIDCIASFTIASMFPWATASKSKHTYTPKEMRIARFIIVCF